MPPRLLSENKRIESKTAATGTGLSLTTRWSTCFDLSNRSGTRAAEAKRSSFRTLPILMYPSAGWPISETLASDSAETREVSFTPLIYRINSLLQIEGHVRSAICVDLALAGDQIPRRTN